MQVRLMCSYCKKHEEDEVPDPYYGGPQGFEKVIDIKSFAEGAMMTLLLLSFFLIYFFVER